MSEQSCNFQIDDENSICFDRENLIIFVYTLILIAKIKF